MNKRDYRVVERNHDKPHRCPRCHAVALRAWEDRGYGARTWLRCEYGCYVRWQTHHYSSRLTKAWRRRLHDDRVPFYVTSVAHLVLAGPRDRHVGRPR
jgi:hypothetical protein